MPNDYINCPKCGTYQTMRNISCKICGADLLSTEENSETSPTNVMSVSAPQTEYVPPAQMSITDYINEHRKELANQPQEEEEVVEEPEGTPLPLYVLVGDDIIQQIKGEEWFKEECITPKPTKSQNWLKGQIFVPITRIEEFIASNQGIEPY